MKVLFLLSTFALTQSFVPPSTTKTTAFLPKCSTVTSSASLYAVRSTQDDDSAKQQSPSKPVIPAFLATSVLTLSILLQPDLALAASAATAPTATAKTTVTSTKGKAAAPVVDNTPAEKKAVINSKAAFDSATAKLNKATADLKTANTANEKATVALAAAEAKSKLKKQEFLNANDALARMISDNANPNAISSQKRKVDDARNADKQAQLDLTTAKTVAKDAINKVQSSEKTLAADTKTFDQAKKNVEKANQDYEKYLKKVAEQEKKAKEEAKKKAKEDEKRKKKEQKIAAKKAKEEGKKAKEAAKKKAEQDAKQRKIEQEKAKKAAEAAKKAAEEKARKIKEAEQKIRELQNARSQMEMTAKKAAAEQAKLDAEVKKIEQLKKTI